MVRPGLVLFLLFFLISSAFPIAPPLNQKSIPEDIASQLKSDPQFYMPDKSLLLLKPSASGMNQTEFANNSSLNLPVLCAQYEDIRNDEFDISDLQQKLFGQWSTGTMRDYYMEVSGNSLELNGNVFGWYKLSGNRYYYYRYQNHFDDLLTELFTIADDSIDFSQFDNDGPDGLPNSGDDDGYVDVVFVVHSGTGAEETNGPEIWSHFGKYKSQTGSDFVTNDLGINNAPILINNYITVPAIQLSRMVEIGVFCHEFGHALGLPDLYDRDGSSAGIGNWGLMGHGSWGANSKTPETPVHFCAWCKEVLGFVNVVTLTENAKSMEIPPVQQSHVVYKLWNHGRVENYIYKNSLGTQKALGKEYFLIENRGKTGFDKILPGDGLLVWHIDNSVSNLLVNDNEKNKLVDLEQADNNRDLDLLNNLGDAGDPFPGSKHKNIFNKTSSPNSLAKDLSITKVAVKNITKNNSNIIADLYSIDDDLLYHGYKLDDSNGNNNGYLEAGETGNVILSITNLGDYISEIKATLTSPDPDVSVLNSVSYYRNVHEEETVNNYDNAFSLSLSPNTEPHPVYCTLNLQADNGYAVNHDFIVLMDNISILVVDDSRGETDTSGVRLYDYYTKALDDIEFINYDIWDISAKGIPNQAILFEYGTVIWFTGSQRYTLTDFEQRQVSSFLNHGGRLFLSGQNLGYDLWYGGTRASKEFYTNYLHAKFIQSGISDHPLPVVLLAGIEGETISETFRPFFYASEGDGAYNQLQPSIIEPDEYAVPIFNYFGTGLYDKNAAIKYEGNYKLVYLAFSFEAINDYATRRPVRSEVMKNIIDWLHGEMVTTVSHENFNNDLVPQDFVLEQNYPNPFNNSTSIEFLLNKPMHARLTIFDILGREVDVLADQQLPAGKHRYQWNGKDTIGWDVSSGIYFYRFECENNVETRKMVYIR